jgi:Protein of unknown function (DUF5818)
VKMVFAAVIVIGCGLCANAQVSPSPLDQSRATSAQVSAGNAPVTVEGCLSGSAGTFTLHDKAGSIYTITGDASKLAAHVGQEVRVTGSANGAAIEAGAAGSSETTASSGTTAAFESMHVSALTKVAGSCSGTQ